MRTYKTLLINTLKDFHGQDLKPLLSQTVVKLLLKLHQLFIKDTTEILARKASMKMFKISLTSMSKDSHGQEVRLLSSQMDLKLLSQQLLPQLSIKDKETAEISLRRTSMLRFTVSLTPWSTESTGTDPKSHSYQTVPKWLSHQLHPSIKDKETEEISPRRTSTPKSTDLLTQWLTESTGTDLKSHSSQTVPKSLSHQLHLFTKDKETEETSPRRTSMPRFTDLPTPWSIELTGTDPKSHSSQMVPKLPSHNQPLSTNTPTSSAILPTQKLDQMSGLLFTTWLIQLLTGEEAKPQNLTT